MEELKIACFWTSVSPNFSWANSLVKLKTASWIIEFMYWIISYRIDSHMSIWFKSNGESLMIFDITLCCITSGLYYGTMRLTGTFYSLSAIGPISTSKNALAYNRAIPSIKYYYSLSCAAAGIMMRACYGNSPVKLQFYTNFFSNPFFGFPLLHPFRACSLS